MANNDRFKFRAWDSETKKYYHDPDVFIEKGSSIGVYKWSNIVVQSGERFIVEQCTGLKDKNGNLIYEGDIVYDSVYDNNFVLSWDNDRTGYILSADNTNHIDYLSKILIARHNIKIVGNIHEQKD